jgi:GTPase SAR1 family protein
MTADQKKRFEQLKSDPNIVHMRILVWGEGAMGCTTIILRMLYRVTLTEYDPTIIDEHELLFKKIGPDRKTVLLTLVDVAGRGEFVHLFFSEKKNTLLSCFALLFSHSFAQTLPNICDDE